MLGRIIKDPHCIEGSDAECAGLGLLNMETVITPEKTLLNKTYHGLAQFDGIDFTGYEIHMGESTTAREYTQLCSEKDICIADTENKVLGTYIHGLFDSADIASRVIAMCGKAINPDYSYHKINRRSLTCSPIHWNSTLTPTLSSLLYIDFMALIAAFWLDWFLGEPDIPFHPVRIAGSAVSYCEKSLRRKGTIFEGVLSAVITLAFTLSAAGVSLYYAAKAGSFWYFVVSTLIIYFSISVRSLAEHADNVRKGLEKSEDEGRKELSKIVSRDTENMPKEKIVTSAVESVSENYVDAVVSPMLFAALFGPMGAVLFKTVSTMDSMIG